MPALTRFVLASLQLHDIKRADLPHMEVARVLILVECLIFVSSLVGYPTALQSCKNRHRGAS